MKKKVLINALQSAFISTACFLTITSAVLAAEERVIEDDKGIFNVVIENDIFAGADRDYTNGVRFSWLSSEERVPRFARSIARVLPLADDGNKRISVAVGQNMYAPEVIGVRTPDPQDHPYAGWLYGSVGMVTDTGKTLNNVVLTAGVVGPLALAGQTQKLVHHITGSPQPKGWGSQLKNEPGVILTYERKWRKIYEFSPFGLGTDFTPHLGFNLGNVNTDGSAGATFRLGYDLPADYGPPRIRPSLPGSDFFIPTKTLGGYLFTTIATRAVAQNIFLDGNTFKDSPHVNKKKIVNSLQLGFAVTYGQTRLSYTHVLLTREYTSQRHKPAYGALTLSYRF